MTNAVASKPIQKWVQDQLDKIDWNSDKPIRFLSLITPDMSPYSSKDTGKKLIRNSEMISRTDVVIDDDGNEVPIRFMAMSSSIIIAEQQAQGVHADYGKTKDRLRNRSDTIISSNGCIEVVPRGNRAKITYLLTTNQNMSNPNRRAFSQGMFSLDDAVEQAKKDFSVFKQIDKARSLVLTLEGNYTRLQEVAKLLSLDTTAEEGQLLLKLRELAEKTPQLIISTISEEKLQVDLLVHKAMELGIVEFNGNSYKFAGTDSIIKGFRGMQNADVAFKQLVAFLGTDEGQVHFLHLNKLVKEYSNKKMAEAV